MRRTKKVAVGIVIVLLCLGLASAGYAGKLNLKMQSNLIPEDTKRVTTKFIDMVSAMTGGQIKITAFPVGSIVPMNELLATVGSGAIEMAWTAEGYWHKLIPVSVIGQGLPFSFRSLEEAKYFMWRRGFVDLLREGYAKHNVHLIPCEPYPVGIMTKNPINTADDFKGMKIRAYGTMADWLTKLGCSTVYIPGGELYTALATGVVDGAHWGDAGPMYIMKFQEVLKNYMKPEPIIGAWNNVFVNMDVWEKMTSEQKAILETAVMGCGGFWSTNDTRIVSIRALNSMKNEWNVKVNTLPEAEINKMQEASMGIWKEISKSDPLAAKGIRMLEDFLAELGYLKK